MFCPLQTAGSLPYAPGDLRIAYAGERHDQKGDKVEISTTEVGGAPLFAISGEIDHSNAGNLSAAVDQPLEQGDPVVLLDLSSVDYIDSGGVSVLLSTVRRLRNRGWLGVINPNANVRRLLEIVGLTVDHGFRLFDTTEEARTVVKETLSDGQGVQ